MLADVILSGPFGTFLPGQPIKGVPSDQLKIWTEQKLTRVDPNEVVETPLFELGDLLDELDQKQLVEVIVLNELQKVTNPMSNWTPAQFRQAIRNVTPDLSTLKLPANAVPPAK